MKYNKPEETGKPIYHRYRQQAYYQYSRDEENGANSAHKKILNWLRVFNEINRKIFYFRYVNALFNSQSYF